MRSRLADVDLEAGQLTVRRQLVQLGWEVYEDDPKSDAGSRTIALDTGTVAALRAHRLTLDIYPSVSTEVAAEAAEATAALVPGPSAQVCAHRQHTPRLMNPLHP